MTCPGKVLQVGDNCLEAIWRVVTPGKIQGTGPQDREQPESQSKDKLDTLRSGQKPGSLKFTKVGELDEKQWMGSLCHCPIPRPDVPSQSPLPVSVPYQGLNPELS